MNPGRSPAPKVRLGISSCLLGEQVRFDGGHKHDPLLTGTLGTFVEWVPVCPEVELGLGVPRETVRLEGEAAAPRMVATRSRIDHTGAMRRFAERRVEELAGLDLDGYVLKKDSPSCGMERVRVHGPRGGVSRSGRGLFARALLERLPLLPVEEEGRLNDVGLRENFIERVFAHRRWKTFLAGRPRAGDLVEFHARQKLAVLAHSPVHYCALGRIAAAAGKGRLAPRLEEYGAAFMTALRIHATPGRHSNVLHHLMGFLKRKLDAEDRAELVACVETYRRGETPLLVPLTLLAHHFRKHPDPWVAGQTYLDPFPAELLLRNHV